MQVRHRKDAVHGEVYIVIVCYHRVGIDLGKRFMQVPGVDEAGKTVLARKLSRAQFEGFFAALPPVLAGLEACASSHHWARLLIALAPALDLPGGELGELFRTRLIKPGYGFEGEYGKYGDRSTIPHADGEPGKWCSCPRITHPS